MAEWWITHPSVWEWWFPSLGLGRFPWEGNGSPLQYSCLGSPMNRGAWQATVWGVTKGTQLSDWTTAALPQNGVVTLEERSAAACLLLNSMWVFLEITWGVQFVQIGRYHKVKLVSRREASVFGACQTISPPQNSQTFGGRALWILRYYCPQSLFHPTF